MSRNRVIYQSEALFASQKSSEQSTFGHQPEDIEQLYRVQSVNYSFNINQIDVNEFSELASIGRISLGTPTVNLDFSYYLANFANEEALGFKIAPNDYEDEELTSAISYFIDSSKEEKNYFIKTVGEGLDANSLEGNESEQGESVIAIGNGFVSSYSVKAEVGGIPTASVSVQGVNMRFDFLDENKQGVIPSLDRFTGEESENKYSLPALRRNVGDEDSQTIPVLKPGDIKISIVKSSSNLVTKENPKFGVFGEKPKTSLNDLGISGGKFPDSSGDIVIDSAHIQNFDISFDLSRDPIQKLGNKFAFSRKISFPVNITINFEAILSELTEGSLSDLINCEKYYDIKLEMWSPSGCLDCFQDEFPVCTYIVRNLKPDEKSFASSIGENKTVSLSFTSQIGSINQKHIGLFMRGVTKKNELGLYNTPPEVTLKGENYIKIDKGNPYTEYGATALDKQDGDLTDKIEIFYYKEDSGSYVERSSLDVNEKGIWNVVYRAEDRHCVIGTALRTVEVYAPNEPPVITLIGEDCIYVEIGEFYVEHGAEAHDVEDGNLTDQIEIKYYKKIADYYTEISNLEFYNMNLGDSYKVEYTVTDSEGLSDGVVRCVKAISNEGPVITLNGDEFVEILKGSQYQDPGATASDFEDDANGIPVPVTFISNLNVNELGDYTISYFAKDSDGNEAIPKLRTIRVITNEKPVISMESTDVCLDHGSNWSDFDPFDKVQVKDSEGEVIDFSSVTYLKCTGEDCNDEININDNPTPEVGEYSIKYIAEDRFGNEAEAYRTVKVYIKPTLNLLEEWTLNSGEINAKISRDPALSDDKQGYFWVNKTDLGDFDFEDFEDFGVLKNLIEIKRGEEFLDSSEYSVEVEEKNQPSETDLYKISIYFKLNNECWGEDKMICLEINNPPVIELAFKTLVIAALQYSPSEVDIEIFVDTQHKFYEGEQIVFENGAVFTLTEDTSSIGDGIKITGVLSSGDLNEGDEGRLANAQEQIEINDDNFYVEHGAKAHDVEDGVLTEQIETKYYELVGATYLFVGDTASVFENSGEYKVVYTVTDKRGSSASIARYVEVKRTKVKKPDLTCPPKLELLGDENCDIYVPLVYDGNSIQSCSRNSLYRDAGVRLTSCKGDSGECESVPVGSYFMVRALTIADGQAYSPSETVITVTVNTQHNFYKGEQIVFENGAVFALSEDTISVGDEITTTTIRGVLSSGDLNGGDKAEKGMDKPFEFGVGDVYYDYVWLLCNGDDGELKNIKGFPEIVNHEDNEVTLSSEQSRFAGGQSLKCDLGSYLSVPLWDNENPSLLKWDTFTVEFWFKLVVTEAENPFFDIFWISDNSDNIALKVSIRAKPSAGWESEQNGVIDLNEGDENYNDFNHEVRITLNELDAADLLTIEKVFSFKTSLENNGEGWNFLALMKNRTVFKGYLNKNSFISKTYKAGTHFLEEDLDPNSNTPNFKDKKFNFGVKDSNSGDSIDYKVYLDSLRVTHTNARYNNLSYDYHYLKENDFPTNAEVELTSLNQDTVSVSVCSASTESSTNCNPETLSSLSKIQKEGLYKISYEYNPKVNLKLNSDYDSDSGTVEVQPLTSTFFEGEVVEFKDEEEEVKGYLKLTKTGNVGDTTITATLSGKIENGDEGVKVFKEECGDAEEIVRNVSFTPIAFDCVFTAGLEGGEYYTEEDNIQYVYPWWDNWLNKMGVGFLKENQHKFEKGFIDGGFIDGEALSEKIITSAFSNYVTEKMLNKEIEGAFNLKPICRPDSNKNSYSMPLAPFTYKKTGTSGDGECGDYGLPEVLSAEGIQIISDFSDNFFVMSFGNQNPTEFLSGPFTRDFFDSYPNADEPPYITFKENVGDFDFYYRASAARDAQYRLIWVQYKGVRIQRAKENVEGEDVVEIALQDCLGDINLQTSITFRFS